jgi:hypothetical protein
MAAQTAMATDTKMTPAAQRWLGPNFVHAPRSSVPGSWFLANLSGKVIGDCRIKLLEG